MSADTDIEVYEKGLNNEKYVEVVDKNLKQIEKEEKKQKKQKKQKKGDGLTATILSIEQKRRMEQLAKDSASAIVARFNFLRTRYQLSERFSREATEELEARITSLQERISQISEQIAVEEEESRRATNEISEISETWASLQIALGKKVDLTSIDDAGMSTASTILHLFRRIYTPQEKIALLFKDAKKNGKDTEALILISSVSISEQPKQEFANLKKLYDEGKFTELSEILEKAIVSAKERFKNSQERLSKLEKEKKQAEAEIEEEHKKFNEKLSKIDKLKKHSFDQMLTCRNLASKIPTERLSEATRAEFEAQLQGINSTIKDIELSDKEQILRKKLEKNNNLDKDTFVEAEDLFSQQQKDKIPSTRLPEDYVDLEEEKQKEVTESRKNFLERFFNWLFGNSLTKEEIKEKVEDKLKEEIEEKKQAKQEEHKQEEPLVTESSTTVEKPKNEPPADEPSGSVAPSTSETPEFSGSPNNRPHVTFDIPTSETPKFSGSPNGENSSFHYQPPVTQDRLKIEVEKYYADRLKRLEQIMKQIQSLSEQLRMMQTQQTYFGTHLHDEEKRRQNRRRYTNIHDVS